MILNRFPSSFDGFITDHAESFIFVSGKYVIFYMMKKLLPSLHNVKDAVELKTAEVVFSIVCVPKGTSVTVFADVSVFLNVIEAPADHTALKRFICTLPAEASIYRNEVAVLNVYGLLVAVILTLYPVPIHQIKEFGERLRTAIFASIVSEDLPRFCGTSGNVSG